MIGHDTTLPLSNAGRSALTGYASNNPVVTAQAAAATLKTTASYSNPTQPWQSFSEHLNAAKIPTPTLTSTDEINQATVKTVAPSEDSLNTAREKDLVDTRSDLSKLNASQKRTTVSRPRYYDAQHPTAYQVYPAVTTSTTETSSTTGNSSSTNTDMTHVMTDEEKEVRKTAGDLVATALILPMLKQNRRSVFGENDILKQNAGENAFGPEFDTQLADRVAHSPHMEVTDGLTRRLMAKRASVSTQTSNRSNGVDLHG